MALNGALMKRKEHRSPESLGNHKIKMVFICCEYGLLVKSLLKQLGISTSELKNSLKWMILESRQRNKENGSPVKLHIELYF